MITLIKALIASMLGLPTIVDNTVQIGVVLSRCGRQAAENFEASLIREAQEEAAKATQP